MLNGRIELSRRALDASLQEFGEQLRHKRERLLHLTQAQMAARVGQASRTVSEDGPAVVG